MKPTSIQRLHCRPCRLIGQGFTPFVQQGMLGANGLFQRRSEFPDVPVFEDVAKEQRPSGVPW